MSHCHMLIETLRQKGYRITPQREMVVEAISHSGRHMTVEDVFDLVQKRSRSINIATVYRVLDLLVDEGLASRTDLGSGKAVYATDHHGPHIHLVCRQCDGVIDADAASFQSLFDYIKDNHGFRCGPQHFAIYGLCAGCQTSEEV